MPALPIPAAGPGVCRFTVFPLSASPAGAARAGRIWSSAHIPARPATRTWAGWPGNPPPRSRMRRIRASFRAFSSLLHATAWNSSEYQSTGTPVAAPENVTQCAYQGAEKRHPRARRGRNGGLSLHPQPPVFRPIGRIPPGWHAGCFVGPANDPSRFRTTANRPPGPHRGTKSRPGSAH